jgi:hypothetical protein
MMHRRAAASNKAALLAANGLWTDEGGKWAVDSKAANGLWTDEPSMAQTAAWPETLVATTQHSQTMQLESRVK